MVAVIAVVFIGFVEYSMFRVSEPYTQLVELLLTIAAKI